MFVIYHVCFLPERSAMPVFWSATLEGAKAIAEREELNLANFLANGPADEIAGLENSLIEILFEPLPR